MSAPLIPVNIISIYEVGGHRTLLPKRMAQCTPDMKMAIFQLSADVENKGGEYVLSDLFRSYDMQLQAHLDFTSGKKKSFSPAPGGSMHEAGRAFDVDLSALKMPLSAFWKIAARCGAVPINAKPDASASEAWHFECRGSHQLVYDYYKSGKGSNFDAPYKAMAASAIAAVGIPVDKFGDKAIGACIQSALIRLGKDIGNMDGDVGPKTKAALSALKVEATSADEQLAALEALLQKQFPGEFFDRTPDPGVIQ
jgi:D-alanyl-D-alanine carboxypeptidase